MSLSDWVWRFGEYVYRAIATLSFLFWARTQVKPNALDDWLLPAIPSLAWPIMLPAAVGLAARHLREERERIEVIRKRGRKE